MPDAVADKSSSTPSPTATAATSTATPAATAPAASSSPTATAPKTGSTSALDAITKAYAAPSESLPDASKPPKTTTELSADPTVGAPTGAATGAPATDDQAPGTPGTTTPQGFVPTSRHEAAVRNAREKTNQEWEAQFGSRDTVANATRRNLMLESDPERFLQTLAKELGWAVTKGEAQPAPADLTDPDPDLEAMDGRRAYSDQAVRKIVDNASTRVFDKVMKEVAPALQYAQTATQRESQERMAQQTTQFAQRAIAEVSRMPHYDREKVKVAFEAFTPTQRQEMGAFGSLMAAYTNHLAQNVLPTLSQTQEAKVIADLQRSAVAGSTTAATATPGSTTARKAIRDGDVNALAERLSQYHGETQVTA